MKKKLIIFDLDGVLINSLSNMRLALKKTEKKIKIKLSFAKYKKFIGLPFENIMKNMGVENNVNLIKKYYTLFSKQGISTVSINKKRLQELKTLSKDYNLAVYTSKDKLRTKQVLKKYKFFKYIVTSDDVIKGKPDKEGIIKILKKIKSNKKNSLYVGDTLYDYKTAKNAGINYVHASWGYGKKINNIKSINSFSEIQKFFK